MTVQKLVEEMRRWGLRVTAQRLAVAEVLVDARDHPTAQQVYERVRARFPHIAMGTVYNTINTLAERGIVQPLSFPAGTRYDANLQPHANAVCVKCGSITDVADEDGAMDRLRERVTSGSGLRVTTQRVDFYGLCERCARESAS